MSKEGKEFREEIVEVLELEVKELESRLALKDRIISGLIKLHLVPKSGKLLTTDFIDLDYLEEIK